MWRLLKIPSVYTLETSLCGGKSTLPHYTLENLMEIGKQICESLTVFLDLQQGKESLARELIADETNLTNNEQCYDPDTLWEASESDSDPCEDTLAPGELVKVLPDSLVQALK